MKLQHATRREFIAGAASTVILGGLLTTPSLARQSQGQPGEVLDALIVGGGPAGLSAALYLGRARKQVLVVDRGQPRHAASAVMHNYLTRDGLPPATWRAEAWRQMAPYASVRKLSSSVTHLRPEGELWLAHLDNGSVVTTRAVILATGMVDRHPQIPGYQERWGHSIHQCPFCHGWEMQDKPLAALSWGHAAAHVVPLLKNWSADVVLLTHGRDIPEAAHNSTRLYSEPIVALEGAGRTLQRIRFQSGAVLERQGLFVKPEQSQVELISSLGVELNDEGFVRVDSWGTTSLPGIWAAGDSTCGFQQVIEATAQGARVATHIVASQLKPATRARESWQKPLEVIDIARIGPGMVVADVGAGEGYFEPYLSAAVGPGGRVMAIDIQPAIVERLRQRFACNQNIEARLGTSLEPGLAPASVDRVILVDTWHHLEDPQPFLRKLVESLKPGGRLVIVDYDRDAEPGPPASMRIDARHLLRECERAGLSAYLARETLPRQFILIAEPIQP